MNATNFNIPNIEEQLINFLANNKRKNLNLLIKGNLCGFLDNVREFLNNSNAAANHGGECNSPIEDNVLRGREILCAYNAIENDLATKFMQELYMNPETNNVIEEEGNPEVCKAMLLINSRKPTTEITHEVFDKTKSMEKNCVLDVNQVLGLAHQDLEVKKSLVYPDDKKPLVTFSPDEAITKAIRFIEGEVFSNYAKRTGENKLAEDKFMVSFQEKWNWNLMWFNITEWFSRLFGYSVVSPRPRYFEVSTTQCKWDAKPFDYPALICIYLVWGQIGKSTPINYKIRDGKIERVEFVVAANSVEVFVHEFYHCLQMAETFIWRIPTDCLEYGAIKFERKFRQKHTKDYVIYRQYMQIAYGIADWSNSVEEFDAKFNELMGLGDTSHFSRQFWPRLLMGKYYYIYALGFMDNLPENILKELSKYSP